MPECLLHHTEKPTECNYWLQEVISFCQVQERKLMEAHYISFLSFSHSYLPPLCLAPFFSRLENINSEETDMVSPLENFMWSYNFSLYHYSESVLYEKTTLRNKGLETLLRKLKSNLNVILCLKFDIRNLLIRINDYCQHRINMNMISVLYFALPNKTLQMNKYIFCPAVKFVSFC